MTRDQLEAVFDELVSNLHSSNQAAADDDRGPANDTFNLTLYDDGSGRIGRRKSGEVEDFYEFSDLDTFAARLKDNGCEITICTSPEQAEDAVVGMMAHILECEKHPLHIAIATCNKLRQALADLVGASTKEDLEQMEVELRLLPVPNVDKRASINAVHVLLETLPIVIGGGK